MTMFFADKVVLVEGITDKIIFEALLENKLDSNPDAVIEVVSVNGKIMFTEYEKILKAFSIPYSIIADKDYLQQIGDMHIKSLWGSSAKKRKERLSKPSRDVTALLTEMDKSINDEKITPEFRELYEMLKLKHSEIKSNITAADQGYIDKYVAELQRSNIFVLREGSIEDYLPFSNTDKDLKKVIEFISGDFLGKMKHSNEIERIVEEICSDLV
jgi:putative ATP-dependent endonuclease of OLD family